MSREERKGWRFCDESESDELQTGAAREDCTHVHDWELGKNLLEPLLERLLRELDLAHVERPEEGREVRRRPGPRDTALT